MYLTRDGICKVDIDPIFSADEVKLIWNLIDEEKLVSKVYKIDQYRKDLWNISNPLFDKNSERFKYIDNQVNQVIKDKTIVRKSIGLLPLLPGGKPGVWHRDIITLFDDESHTLSLPNFYYTVFIPIDVKNQATDFVLGSHWPEYKKSNYVYQTITHNINEMIIMNGKTYS